MRHTLIDRIARLLILGALATGYVGTLSAQSLVLDQNTDVTAALKQSAEQIDGSWVLKPGLYVAGNSSYLDTDTGPRNAFSGPLTIGGGTVLQAAGSRSSLAGLASKNGNVTQTGGHVSVMGNSNGTGFFLKDGDYDLHGGTLYAAAEGYDHAKESCSSGLRLAEGDFVQHRGIVNAYGADGGDGIVLNRGGYTIDAGELNTYGEKSTFIPDRDGIRIYANGGTITYFGTGTDYYGCGLVLDEGDFTQNGGTVNAYARDGGCGIYIGKGDFVQNGGTFALRPGGSDGGLASVAVAGNALIGSAARFNTFTDGMSGSIGTMLVAGDTVIEDGATFDVGLANSIGLRKDAPLVGAFLKTEKAYDDPLEPAPLGTIRGELTAVGTETLTLNYRIDKSADGKEYVLTSSRTSYASEWIGGNNARLAESLEKTLPTLNTDLYADLHGVYTRLDVTTTVDEMNAIARSLSPWQATQFARMSIDLVDSAQAGVSRNLAWMSTAKSSCDPCQAVDGCGTKSNNRHLWFAGHGSFGHYGAKSGSFSALDVDSYGMNVGMARKLSGWGRNAVAGIGFNYTHGDIDGNSSDTDYNYYGLLASLRTDLRRFKGWGEFSFGYSRARFDQGRYDLLGYRHDSEVDQDIVRLGVNFGRDFIRSGGGRLTPVAGLEYTFISQDGYTEYGRFSPFDLTVGGDDINSLRLRFGLEGEMKRKDVTLSARGFLRYEMLDRYPVLDSYFTSARAVRFRNEGQKVDRCSGVLGIGLNWHLNSLTDITAAYDLTVGDKYTEQWVDLGLRRSW